MTTPLPRPVAQARDATIARVARFGDREPVAVAARCGIAVEVLVRRTTEAYPQLVRAVWGLVSREDLAQVSERISALEDKVRELEGEVAKR